VRCHVELPPVHGRTGKLGSLHNPKALLLVHLRWLFQGAAQHLGDAAVVEGAQGAQHLGCSAHHGPQDMPLCLLTPHTLSRRFMKWKEDLDNHQLQQIRTDCNISGFTIKHMRSEGGLRLFTQKSAFQLSKRDAEGHAWEVSHCTCARLLAGQTMSGGLSMPAEAALCCEPELSVEGLVRRPGSSGAIVADPPGGHAFRLVDRTEVRRVSMELVSFPLLACKPAHAQQTHRSLQAQCNSCRGEASEQRIKAGS